jgi:hypothetical protein
MKRIYISINKIRSNVDKNSNKKYDSCDYLIIVILSDVNFCGKINLFVFAIQLIKNQYINFFIINFKLSAELLLLFLKNI